MVRAGMSMLLTCPNRMNASTRSADLGILLHAVNKQVHGLCLEVNVTVQGQQITVFRLKVGKLCALNVVRTYKIGIERVLCLSCDHSAGHV